MKTYDFTRLPKYMYPVWKKNASLVYFLGFQEKHIKITWENIQNSVRDFNLEKFIKQFSKSLFFIFDGFT